jgi:hypothetical protein
MEVIMRQIGTLIIRIGAAAFVTAMAGKIIHVTVAHSREAPITARTNGDVGHERAVAVADADLTERQQPKHYFLAGSHDAASPTIKSTSPGTTDIAKSIRDQNVDCPTVMSVSSRGRDAYGRVFRVQCSPVRGTSSDGFSYLRVTIQPNGEAVITPEH